MCHSCIHSQVPPLLPPPPPGCSDTDQINANIKRQRGTSFARGEVIIPTPAEMPPAAPKKRKRATVAGEPAADAAAAAAAPKPVVAKACPNLKFAIRSNSPELVEEHLSAGSHPQALKWDVTLAMLEDKSSEYADTWLACVHRSEPPPTTLHLAVKNCYENHGDPASKYCTDQKRAANALAILKSLLKHGADPAVQCGGKLYACNIEGYKWHPCPRGCTPIELALFLKQHLRIFVGTQQGAFLDTVISVLQKAAVKSGHGKPAMVSVPESTLALWESMLFSEKFSDVHFACEDSGALLHAHKCVLARASPYFSALFEGPWSSQHEDGRIPTTNPELIMRAILSFVYTGSLDPKLLETSATTLLSVAGEYDLPSLRKICEADCIRSIAATTVKDLLQLADLHAAVRLAHRALCLLPSVCPVPSAYCPMPTAHCPLPTAHCQLPTALYPLSTLLCPLPTLLCLPCVLCPLCSVCPLSCPLFFANCPLPSALCPLPSALCPLSTLCLLSTVICQLPSSFCPLPTVLSLCPLSSAHCPIPTAHCPLPLTHYPLPSGHCPLPSALYPPPSAFCPLSFVLYPLSSVYPVSSAHCPMPTAHCPLPTALCPLPSAPCPLPSALCPPSSALCPGLLRRPVVCRDDCQMLACVWLRRHCAAWTMRLSLMTLCCLDHDIVLLGPCD